MKKQVVRRSRKLGHRWVQDGWQWTCRSCNTSKRSVQISNGLHQWEYSHGEMWTNDCPSCSASLKRS